MFYIGKDGELNSLAHWKYKYRYRKDGAWRYVYEENDGTTSESRNKPIKKRLGYDEYDKAESAMSKYNLAVKSEKGYSDIRTDPTREKWYNSEKHKELSKERADAAKVASEALKKYYKTPLGKIDKLDDKIDNGRKAISKALTKLAKAIAPKEEYLDYLSSGK